jgi:uncharacterized protein (DUF1697 family)
MKNWALKCEIICTEREEFIINDSAVYLYCPDGYGGTKLSIYFLESKFKVSAATRNRRSANEILKMTRNYIEC